MMLLSPYRFGAAAGSTVVSLLHFDGAPGSTAIVDEKGHVTWTAYGAASIDATRAMFGQSLLLNGTNGYIEAAPSDVFLFHGDFTLEFFAFGNVGGNCVFSNDAKTYLYNNTLVVNNKAVLTSLGLDATQTWKHIAITRASNTLRLFQSGVLKQQAVVSEAADFRALNFGRYKPTNGMYYSGNIDELRIDSGTAWYTANFTPPTAPF